VHGLVFDSASYDDSGGSAFQFAIDCSSWLAIRAHARPSELRDARTSQRLPAEVALHLPHALHPLSEMNLIHP
jgi:hypothetical protein